MGPEEDRIIEAREAVDAVRGLLLRGTREAMEAGIPRLEFAVGHLEAVKRGVEAGSVAGKTATESLAGLRHAISRITRLVEHSAAFYLGWRSGPETGVCDYTPAGERPAPCPPRTLSIEG